MPPAGHDYGCKLIGSGLGPDTHQTSVPNVRLTKGQIPVSMGLVATDRKAVSLWNLKNRLARLDR